SLLILCSDASQDWRPFPTRRSSDLVACLTVRANTERPVTCLHGTNRLVAPRWEAILAAAARARHGRSPARPVIERWDGRTAERIARVLCEGVRYDANEAEPSAGRPPRQSRRAVAIPQPATAGCGPVRAARCYDI